MTRFTRFSLLAGLLFSGGLLQAQDAPSAEARLRETLRATTLQLRAAQNEVATAQADRDALTADKKALETELAALKKQLVADRVENDKIVAALKASATTQSTELTRQTDELEKTRASLAKVVDLARKTEAERVALASRATTLDAQVEDYRTRNVALFKLGNEILDRYAKFGLGEAITAREPFTGLTRVKLENLVQDYGDKLAAQRIKPAATP